MWQVLWTSGATLAVVTFKQHRRRVVIAPLTAAVSIHILQHQLSILILNMTIVVAYDNHTTFCLQNNVSVMPTEQRIQKNFL